MGMIRTPRWYQNEAVDETFALFDRKGGWDAETNAPRRVNPLICLPTGTGKAFVIALMIERALRRFPMTRIIMSTHIKELIEQNAKTLREHWADAPLGINSAGLKDREFAAPIIYGGIKSMVGQLDDAGHSKFGFRDLMFIDEAHLVSPNADTSYVRFIMELMLKNPWLKIIGLSATPFRMGLGHLTDGDIFTDVAYNLCTIEGFQRLLSDGFLSPIFPRPTGVKLDVSGVGMANGDFNQNALEAAVDHFDINYQALGEMVKYGWNRLSWMIFASGIAHAEHLAETLRVCYGVPAAAVHSKMPRSQAEAIIADFKRGKLRCIVNKDMLTTGFDFPPIDLIGMFRPSMSTGLWVQMLGRGTRPWLGGQIAVSDTETAYWPHRKEGCMVLDYAGNTPRLGPINDPVVPKKKGEGPPGDAPIRICHEDRGGCGFYNHSSAKFCSMCGFEFPAGEGPSLNATAGTDELIRSDLPVVKFFNVERVLYSEYVSRGKGRNMIRVAYFCEGANCFYEYKSVEPKTMPDGSLKSDYMTKDGRDWFRQRTGMEPPETNAEVLAGSSFLRTPKRISVWTNKKPAPEVKQYEF
jgi:DNA repair protein RadD